MLLVSGNTFELAFLAHESCTLLRGVGFTAFSFVPSLGARPCSLRRRTEGSTEKQYHYKAFSLSHYPPGWLRLKIATAETLSHAVLRARQIPARSLSNVLHLCTQWRRLLLPCNTYLRPSVPRTATESASIPDRACRNTMCLLKDLAVGAGFELTSFIDNLTPPYAILSHTRTDSQEVTYSELLAGAGADKRGYAEIRFYGKRAAADELEYF